MNCCTEKLDLYYERKTDPRVSRRNVLSDAVYLLSRGPRAQIRERYPVEIARPRDLIGVRGHPSFAPLLQRIWHDLSKEVDIGGARA